MVASISKIVSSVHGFAYYERNGHYARGDSAHREASAWAGKGATALGLRGPVDAVPFSSVLEGRVSGGLRLGRRNRHGNVLHRPSRDVTLSAPKSVSLLALVGGDERILSAHDRAVRQTLDWIEASAVETRLTDPASGAIVRAGGQDMVAATFRHDTSRNLDPHLHTHCVVASTVRGSDGKWRTMVSDGLYNCKSAIGAIYRAGLARGLRELGYLLERTHADGRFEIAGVPRKVVQAFSTRRAEIEASLADHDPTHLGSSPGPAALAALVPRSPKPDKTREDARRAWSLQAGKLGFAPAALVAEAQARRATGLADRAVPAEEAVEGTVRSLAEHDVVFAHAALLVTALGHEPGAVTAVEALRAVETMCAEGQLHAAEGFRRGPHWTTDPDIAAESESIAWMRAGLGSSRAILQRRTASALLRSSEVLRQHREALLFVLSARDRVIGLQGFDGPGKAALLCHLRTVLAGSAYQVTALTPSALQARDLQRESGIASEPLPSFIARHTLVVAGQASARVRRGLRDSVERTLQVVDGASLLTTMQMRDLLGIVTAQGVARVVLMGDCSGSANRDHGRPFAQLLRAGMPAAVMDESNRQLEAEWAGAGRARLTDTVAAAFAKLGDRVSEVPQELQAIAVAGLWMGLPAAEREATAVTAQSPALRHRINEAIRRGLILKGTLRGRAFQGERLAPRNLNRVLLADPASYLPGNTVVFRHPYKRLGVRKGDERTVVEVEAEASIVRLADSRGRTTDWKPGSLAALTGGIELFRSEPLELRAGDRIRWTRDDPALGLAAGETAQVEVVKAGRVRFRLENGIVAELPDSDPGLRYLERAWVPPPRDPQLRSARSIIAAVETSGPHLAAEESLYAALSSVAERAWLITDDAARLADFLESVVGERFEALTAAAGQSPE